MKIRNGFVSNSSSSSFVVSMNPDEKCKATVTLEVDLSEHGIKIESIGELKDYAHDQCWDDEDGNIDEDYKEDYNRMAKLIESGKTIIAGDFYSDSGDPTESFLCEKGLKGHVDESKVNIIFSEGGY